MYPGVSFPVCYSIARITREKAGPAKMIFGVDWRAKIWVNGVRVSPLDGTPYDEKNPPKGWNAWGSAQGPIHRLTIELKAGENVVSFKTGSGRSGNKFWALIENEARGAAARRERIEELERLPRYEDLVPNHDPNVYHWW